MSKDYQVGHNASVLHKDKRVRDVVLAPTDPCKMVCAPSLVLIPVNRVSCFSTIFLPQTYQN